MLVSLLFFPSQQLNSMKILCHRVLMPAPGGRTGNDRTVQIKITMDCILLLIAQRAKGERERTADPHHLSPTDCSYSMFSLSLFFELFKTILSLFYAAKLLRTHHARPSSRTPTLPGCHYYSLSLSLSLRYKNSTLLYEWFYSPPLLITFHLFLSFPTHSHCLLQYLFTHSVSMESLST